jgi:5'-nucleotidase
MTVLVTNDDGIASPGIWALAEALIEGGYEPTIAGPAEDMSGASASLWRMNDDAHVEIVAVDTAEPLGVPAWSVAASPGLIVLSAARGAFDEVPDLVVAGINAGLNLGESILHSGTVGAALTAQRCGISAMSVSLQPGEPWRWSAAATLAVEQLAVLAGGPRGTVLNLNVPHGDRAPEVRWAELSPHGTVHAAVPDDGGAARQLEVRSTAALRSPQTDAALIAAGYATITAVGGVHECPQVPTERERPRLEHSVHPVPTGAVVRHGAPRSARPRPDQER